MYTTANISCSDQLIIIADQTKISVYSWKLENVKAFTQQDLEIDNLIRSVWCGAGVLHVRNDNKLIAFKMQ